MQALVKTRGESGLSLAFGIARRGEWGKVLLEWGQAEPAQPKREQGEPALV